MPARGAWGECVAVVWEVERTPVGRNLPGGEEVKFTLFVGGAGANVDATPPLREALEMLPFWGGGGDHLEVRTPQAQAPEMLPI